LHRHDAHEKLFEGYQLCLQTLQSSKANDATLRNFELLVLRELGYGLVLDHDTVDNVPIQAEHRYEYIADSGPRRLSSGEPARIGVEIRGATLLALADGDLSGVGMLKELKLLLRFLLKRHLGDRPLNSRRLMQSMKHHATHESEQRQS